MNYPGGLHNHSDYSNRSIRDSIIKVKDLIDYSIELGHEVVALTDHDCLSGHLKALAYYRKIKEKNPNFKLILGNEIYLCRDGLNQDNYVSGQDRYWHFILLAKDAIGHKQIRLLSTRAWMRSYMARGQRRVPTYYSDLEEIIGKDPGHVIGCTACLGGALPAKLLAYATASEKDENLYATILQFVSYLQGIFGKDNFFLELQPEGSKEQAIVNKELLKLGLPYIITTDSHYAKQEDRMVHKAYLNSQDGEREVDNFYATTYIMAGSELESYMTSLSREQLDEAYRNILLIKNACEDYDLRKPLKIPELLWKEHPEPAEIVKKRFVSVIPYLDLFFKSDYVGDKKLANAVVNRIAADTTLQNDKTYAAIDECLKATWDSSIVNKAHWSAYYLNLQRIIDACWEAGSIVGPGRGSGVGFILLYLLDITQINPLREATPTFSWRFGSRAS